MDPKNSLAVAKAVLLKTKAMEKATLAELPGSDGVVDPKDPLVHISSEELLEVPRLRPPPSLAPTEAKITMTLSGNGKEIYTQFLKKFGLEVIFDGDYDNPLNRQVKLEDAGFDEALYIVNLATGSFVNPLTGSGAECGDSVADSDGDFST